MDNATTIREAVLECFRAHSGESMPLHDIKAWIFKRYPNRWAEVTTDVAGLTIGASLTSGYRSTDQFLERVGRGVYRLSSAYSLATAKAHQSRGQPAVAPTPQPTETAPPSLCSPPLARSGTRFWIPGVPSVWGTAGEVAWREVLTNHIPSGVPRTPEPTGIHLRFSLEGLARSGQPFDLDNLCEPVLRVLVSGQGHFKGRRPNIQWWSATRQVKQPTGVEIELGGTPTIDLGVGRLIVHGVYRGDLPKRGSETALADWVQGIMLQPPAKSEFSIGMAFGSHGVNIADVSTGPTKPVIDNLFPILGGRVSSPEDWRIARLHVVKGYPGLSNDQLLLTVMSLTSE